MKSSHQSFVDKRGLRTIIFTITAIMGIVYFFQITSSSARGYELKKLSDHKSGLEGETGRIELYIAEESSAQQLKKRVENLGLAVPKNIEYIHDDQNSVAIK